MYKYLSKAFSYLILNVDLSLRNKSIRLVLLIFTILSGIFGLKNFSRDNYLNAQYAFVQKQFAEKKPSLMLDILSTCQGDLTNPKITQECVDLKQKSMLNPIKKRIFETRIYIIIWGLLNLIFFGTYYVLSSKQNKIKKMTTDE